MQYKTADNWDMAPAQQHIAHSMHFFTGAQRDAILQIVTGRSLLDVKPMPSFANFLPFM